MELNQPLDKILGPLIEWLRIISVTMEMLSGDGWMTEAGEEPAKLCPD